MVNLSFSMIELEFFLLIVVRVTCFIFAAPFFGMNNTPRRVKVTIGVFMSAILYNTVPHVAVEYSTVLLYALYVIKEAFTGIIIGMAANVCLSITNFAGHLVDMQIGLSMVSLFDPVSKSNVTITGTLYQYSVMLMLLISGMYQFLVGALKETFNLIPVTGAIFSTENLLLGAILFLKDYLILGFRLCLPVFASMLLLNAILGILAKVSPQLNMFAVGIQLKIIVGLVIMFVTIGMLPTASTLVLSEIRKMVTVFAEAMT